jgi:hypothetical protein
VPIIPATWEMEIGRSWSRLTRDISETLFKKKKKKKKPHKPHKTEAKRAGSITQVVEHLPNKH